MGGATYRQPLSTCLPPHPHSTRRVWNERVFVSLYIFDDREADGCTMRISTVGHLYNIINKILLYVYQLSSHTITDVIAAL